ncbi:MAG: hypothetical protein NTW74_05345 [Acidobacteria bacterium]|nr:hypothetical protein [Acidobacteriota bacterium]
MKHFVETREANLRILPRTLKLLPMQIKKTSLGLTLAALTLCPLMAQKKPAAATGLPPIIDRELLFGNPEIAGAQLSPDGKYIAFQKPYKDTRNVWVKKAAEPFSAARLLTTETKRPIDGFFWSRDSKYVLFVKDNDGDENFNIFAVDPAAPAAAGADAPAARDLTGVKGIQIQIYSLPKNDPDVVQIEDLHRRENPAAQEHRENRGLGIR